MSALNEVENAIKACRKAFTPWAQTPLAKRIEFLKTFRDKVIEQREELAITISRETGKPLWESRGEGDAVAGKVDISLRAYTERTGTKCEKKYDIRHVIRHRPHGVVAVFGPFNFPAHLPNGHIVPALLAGNTCVFKPSELTPQSGKFLVDLWRKASLPEGVLELVQGDRIIGEQLANHPEIDGLFFTGSVSTGLILSQAFGQHPEKILALELGGNNPLVVSTVKQTAKAVDIIIKSAFLTSGQRCTCARRLIVIGEQAELMQELLTSASKLVVGKYTDQPEPFMGPVINVNAANKLLAIQERLRRQGAKLLLEMHALPLGEAFVSPAILDVTELPDRADEEYFGPLLQVIHVNSLEAAIREANNTRFGLAASLLSDKKEDWEQFVLAIRAGVVNWNLPTTGASSAMPFGGIGLSGNHRPSAYYAADYCAYPLVSMEKDEV